MQIILYTIQTKNIVFARRMNREFIRNYTRRRTNENWRNDYIYIFLKSDYVLKSGSFASGDIKCESRIFPNSCIISCGNKAGKLRLFLNSV